jgi:hypothetical protein
MQVPWMLVLKVLKAMAKEAPGKGGWGAYGLLAGLTFVTVCKLNEELYILLCHHVIRFRD